MTLREFGADLAELAPVPVYHSVAPNSAKLPYLAWNETGGSYLYANNRPAASCVSVQLDYYTKKELDPLLDKILAALDELDVAYEHPLHTYDPDSKCDRHIIDCEVM